MKKIIYIFYFLAIIIDGISAQNNTINIAIKGDADGLNPFTSVSYIASTIINLMNVPMYSYNDSINDLTPFLVKELPIKVALTKGKYAGCMRYDFEIRDEAKWDNGSNITAFDVLFTIKVNSCHQINNDNIRPYFEHIKQVLIDDNDSNKFSIIFAGTGIINYNSLIGLYIMPSYFYDSANILSKYSIEQFQNNKFNESEIKEIKTFASNINNLDNSHDNTKISGSGAYRLEKWTTGLEILLVKKDNWWGNAIKNNENFIANPNAICFKIIPDELFIKTNLNNQIIDVSYSMPSAEFIECQSDKKIAKENNFIYTEQNAYIYLGLNTKIDIFKEIETRKAIAYLINYDYLLNELNKGFSKRVYGIIADNKSYYNTTLPLYRFNIDSSNILLDAAGWNKRNKEGIRYKEIDGKLVILKIDLLIDEDNINSIKLSENIKTNAFLSGVEINVIKKEWTVLFSDLSSHNFQIYLGAWSSPKGYYDPKQIWHTNSYYDGSNYTGFGNKYTDKLIDEIRNTEDEENRIELYKNLQTEIANEIPYIFLHSPFSKIILNKSITNIHLSRTMPFIQINKLIKN